MSTSVEKYVLVFLSRPVITTPGSGWMSVAKAGKRNGRGVSSSD